MRSSTKSWVGWVAAIVIATASLSACGSADRDASGEVIEEGYVSAWAIKVGDCLTDTFESASSTEFSSANAVPCDQPHVFEAYHSEDITGDSFPTDLDTIADDICYFAFVDFVGISVEETYLTYSSLQPTQESWVGKIDREITCVVSMSDSSDITGTLRNSG